MADEALLTIPVLSLDGIGWTITGSVSGTANISLPAIAVLTEGDGGSIAEAAVTLPALSIAAAGITGEIGTADMVLPALIAQGLSHNQADLTLPSLTLDAAGAVGLLGSADITLGALSVAAASSLPFVGTGALSLGAVSLSSAGTTGSVGTVNSTLRQIALAAEGHTGIVGTADLTLPVLSISASGGLDLAGTATLSIPALRLVATGSTGAAGTTNAWALQTQRMALSTYDDLPAFNSLAQFNGVYLGATSAGIFALTGAADAATAIDAVLRTGSTDFSTSHLKRIERVWLQYETDGELTLTVITDGGVRTSYPLPPTGSTGLHGHSVKIGQGLKSKYWAFEVANVDGSDFSLDVIEPKPLVLQRRHGGGNA
jgi:hypothetical protein